MVLPHLNRNAVDIVTISESLPSSNEENYLGDSIQNNANTRNGFIEYVHAFGLVCIFLESKMSSNNMISEFSELFVLVTMSYSVLFLLNCRKYLRELIPIWIGTIQLHPKRTSWLNEKWVIH